MTRASRAAGIERSPWRGSALGALGAWNQIPPSPGDSRGAGGHLLLPPAGLGSVTVLQCPLALMGTPR